jgi:transposase
MKPKARGPEVSPGTRREIIGLRKGGMKYPAIEEELGVKADTCRKIMNRRDNGHQSNSAPRSGRPKKLDDRDRRHLEYYITKNRWQRREPLADISATLNLNVHPDTLRTVLTEMGLGHRIERKRPYLSAQQKNKRLEFAKTHIHWGNEEWRRVEFTDEMGLQTGANQGNIYVWRYPEEEYDEDTCAATHKSGFKKIKVWGAMRYGALSNLVVLSEKKGGGKFNAKEYVEEIMDGELFDIWVRDMEELGDVLIMEDGAGYHQGQASLRREQYLKDGWQGWGPGTWPANSPDLNPIENLWHILRTNIKKREPRPMKKQELIDALKEEWAKLDMDIINRLIDSMPRRLQAVIDAQGGSTHY